MHSGNCVCGTADQFCYGDHTSDVFHGLFSVSNMVKGALYSSRRSLEIMAKHSLFQIITVT